MSALLLTLPLGKYFGFDEIWDDATAVEGLRQVGEAGQACYWIHHKVAAGDASGARHTEAYCSSLSWNGTKPGPADDDGRGDGVSRRRSSMF